MREEADFKDASEFKKMLNAALRIPRPSEVLVSAKKAILNNKLVDYLLKNTVRPKEIASKGLNKLLTKNAADIKSVLAADTGKIITHKCWDATCCRVLLYKKNGQKSLKV